MQNTSFECLILLEFVFDEKGANYLLCGIVQQMAIPASNKYVGQRYDSWSATRLHKAQMLAP